MMAYNWKADLPRLEAKYGLPPGILGALVRAESGGNPSARSPAGAVGLTQLMPGTARGLGVDPYNPAQNLEGGAKYLAQQIKTFKSIPKALAAYNAGPGAVQKYGGIPPYQETQKYVSRVTGFWKESSRYGTKGTTHAPGAPQKPVQGGQKPIRARIPQALPKPELQREPGLEDRDVAMMNQVFEQDPIMAQAVLRNRQSKQDQYTTEFNRKQAAYEGRLAEIEQAKQLNGLKLNQPNRYPTGATVGSTFNVGGVGKWNPMSKFVKTPNGWVRNLQQGEQPYQFIQRVGQRGFGLRNDPGNSQTYGGGHTSGSEHYDRRAVDFGTALNTRQQLMSYAQYMKRLGFDVLDEGDHFHTSAPGSGI